MWRFFAGALVGIGMETPHPEVGGTAFALALAVFLGCALASRHV